MSQVADIHQQSGDPGLKQTYLARSVDLLEIVRPVVKTNKACQSIDSASVHWKKGKLGVENNWSRLSMDIIFNSHRLRSLQVCSVAAYRRQDATSVIRQSETIFEWGPPTKILTDNDPAFTCKHFKEFASSWCAHSPAGNRIVERSYRSIKTIMARKKLFRIGGGLLA